LGSYPGILNPTVFDTTSISVTLVKIRFRKGMYPIMTSCVSVEGTTNLGPVAGLEGLHREKKALALPKAEFSHIG
jgi:hypothetical protein